MNESALIIFVRNPILGKVKTRLAKTVGDDRALEIYNKLLQHTKEVTQELACDKFIFYADHINKNDIWPDAIYKKKLQDGNDLGNRMEHAFATLFKLGYAQIGIIGSDCFELTTENLQRAFIELKSNTIVIGPSKDGGYYFLGMRKLCLPLFKNKQWSTKHVFNETMVDVHNLNCSFSWLPTLRDVDEEKDVPACML